MQLSEIQKTFAGAMFEPIEAIENPSEKLASIFTQDELSLYQRLNIYRFHIIHSLTDVLSMTFPLVRKLTGEDFLRSTCKDYVMGNPPKEACLEWYGKELGNFIETYAPAKNLPYLADCARLDWALNEAKCGKDDDTLQAEDLAAIEPDAYADTVFHLKHCVQLLRSDYPLDTIYDYCNKIDEGEKKQEDGEDSCSSCSEDTEVKPEMLIEDTLDISGPETFLMITRVGWEPTIFKLEKAEFCLLREMANNKPLGECVENALEIDPDLNFGDFLQNYISLGIFSRFETNR